MRRFAMTSLVTLLLTGLHPAQQQYQTDTNTVALWHMNECLLGINTAFDSSGNSHHGALMANVAWSPFGAPLSGNCCSLLFDGTNDMVDICHSSALDLLGSFTIEAWVKWLGQTGASDTIIAKRRHCNLTGCPPTTCGSASSGYRLDVFNNGIVGFHDHAGTLLPLPSASIASTSPIPVNQWTHVAVTYDSASGVVNLYIDCTSNNSVTVAPSSSLTGNGSGVTIGTDPHLSGTYFNGSIDEVRISNVARIPTAFGCGGTPAYPGVGADLVLGSGINTGPVTSGPGNDVKSAMTGDIVNIRIESPGGALHGSLFVVLGQAFTTNNVPVFPIAGFYVLIPGFVVLVDGGVVQNMNLLTPSVGTCGNTYGFLVPPGLSGQSVLVQAVAVPAAQPFVSTDAHEIQIQ